MFKRDIASLKRQIVAYQDMLQTETARANDEKVKAQIAAHITYLRNRLASLQGWA